MKQILFALALTLINVFIYSAASAQKIQPEPYWVIENNVKTPKQSIVYFYSPEHQLMYKEEVNGKRLNVKRKKIIQRLNAALQEAVVAWTKDNKTKEEARYIARRF